MDFVVGIPHLYHEDLLQECVSAALMASITPQRVIIIDNGGRLRPQQWHCEIVRPRENLGVAGSWNLLHKLARPDPLILLNDDCTVAYDTFEKMLVEPSSIVLAWGFSCFLMRESVWKLVGEFDEAFFPVYWEDADYRHRCELLEVPIVEWSTEPRTAIDSSYGRRERSPCGIVHGKHEENTYQGWRGEDFKKFHEALEANRQYYIRKWGGELGRETKR